MNKIVFLAAACLAACSEHNHAEDDHHSHDAPLTAAQLESQPSPNHQDDHEDEHEHDDELGNSNKAVTRSAASHIHGGAELAIALDENVLSVEFETPLYNLLGFEHVPDTDIQKAQVEKAEMQLLKGADLFTFNVGAKCRVSSQNKSINLFPETSEHKDGHEHEDEEQGEHHADKDDHDSNHKDILLRYGYSCQNPDKLANVTVNLFEFFDDLSDIDVTYLGPSIQKQTGLTRNNIMMDLKP